MRWSKSSKRKCLAMPWLVAQGRGLVASRRGLGPCKAWVRGSVSTYRTEEVGCRFKLVFKQAFSSEPLRSSNRHCRFTAARPQLLLHRANDLQLQIAAGIDYPQHHSNQVSHAFTQRNTPSDRSYVRHRGCWLDQHQAPRCNAEPACGNCQLRCKETTP